MAKSEGPLFLEAWLAFLGAHSRAVSLVSAELEEACGISLAWFDVLFQTNIAPERRLRMHELADVLLLSKSGLTRLIDRVEEAGLVERVVVPGDRRSLYVQLTRHGRQVLRKATVVTRGSIEEHFGSRLRDSELRVLRDSLPRVAPIISKTAKRENPLERSKLQKEVSRGTRRPEERLAARTAVGSSG